MVTISHNTPINVLPLKKTEIVHTNNGEEQLACLTLILDDTDTNYQDVLESFLETIGVTGRMIITDVVPDKEKGTAEIIFRNLCNKEILDLMKRNLLPSGAVEEIFGDFLHTHALNKTGAFQSLETQVTLGEQTLTGEPEKETDVEVEGELFATQVSETQLITLLEKNIKLIPQTAEQTKFSITTTFAEAHMAQMLNVNSHVPAFLITTEAIYEEQKQENALYIEDFLTVLDFPYPDTPAYFESTAALMHALTGVYNMNISANTMSEVRGETLSLIIRIAGGSEAALKTAFSYINKIKKVSQKIKKRQNGDLSIKPTTEEIKTLFLAEAINRVYAFMHPSTIAAITQENREGTEFLEDINIVDGLLKNTGIEEVFEELINQEKQHSFNFSLSPTTQSTQEEIVSYYAETITAHSLPEPMRPLISSLKMPLLFEHNWANGEPDVEETKTNTGNIIVSKLITTAVWYARLSVIAYNTKANINPIGCLIRGISHTEESITWAYEQGYKRLADPDGLMLFKELFVAGLTNPHIDENFLKYEVLLNTGLAHALHNVGHNVLEEEWLPTTFNNSVSNNSLLKQFLVALFNNPVENISGETIINEDEDESNCQPMFATVSFLHEFNFREQGEQLVTELGEFIIKLAELNAYKHTEAKEGSPEWDMFIKKYLTDMFHSQEQ